MKIVEIAGTASRLRYEYFSSFLKKNGVENTFDFIETDIEGFPGALKKAMKEYEHIRVGSPFGEKVPQEMTEMPLSTLAQKSADSLVMHEGKWWPRNMLTEGLIREVALIEKLDISETAFIVGAGASSRAVIAALLKMGFKKFNITEKFEERGALLLKDLRSTYFGIDFRFTPQSSITLLPGIHSIVVNTTPLMPTNDLLSELYYCNFLKPSGVYIELTLHPVKTPLLQAVEKIGGRVVHGYEVSTLVDCYWAKVSMGLDLEVEDYSKGLRTQLDGVQFDFSGFEIPEF